MSSEHVQRFSARLLEQLEAKLQAGCSAWSEQLAPSLCAVLDHFECMPLLPTHLPDEPKERYGVSSRISEEEYRRLCTDPTTRGQLLHALKF